MSPEIIAKDKTLTLEYSEGEDVRGSNVRIYRDVHLWVSAAANYLNDLDSGVGHRKDSAGPSAVSVLAKFLPRRVAEKIVEAVKEGDDKKVIFVRSENPDHEEYTITFTNLVIEDEEDKRKSV